MDGIGKTRSNARILKDDEMRHFSMKEDTSKQFIHFTSRVNNDTVFSFGYQFDTSGILVLKKDDLRWTYQRKYNSTAPFKLNQQPFVWISVSPRNY
jgi:hypothetical protein